MEQDDVISLQDYLVVLKRQRWIILSTVALVVVAALAFSFAQTPVYEAQAEIVVEPMRRTQDVSLEDLLLPQSNVVQTERLVVTSRPVAERVVEQLGMSSTTAALNRIRVESVADTRVLRIVADHTDPVSAAQIADAFADAYLDFKRDQAVEGLLAARANIEQRAEDVRAEIDALDEADDADEVERGALLAQLAQLVSQTAELGDASGTVTGGGSVLTPAEIPTAPVSPRPLRTGALAVVLGMLLGVGLAFLRDHIDDVIRDEADFKRATGDRPILGRIPTWPDPDGGDRLATIVEPSSLASESYRELSAGVRFLLLAHTATADLPGAGDAPNRGRSVLLTSASAGDGKTSTAANLAVAAARVGLRTLLVDADMRRPTVAERFGLGRTTGLSDLLLSGDQLRDHLVAVGVPNLLVLPAGSIPPNPTELLASPAMRALEVEVLRHVDLVIYDSPAVLAVPDALELGRHADVAIIVGRAGTTGRRQLQSAIERLEQVGTDVAGGVMNEIDADGSGYYYSYYYSEPAQQPAEGEKSRRTRQAAREERKAAKSRRGRKAARETQDAGEVERTPSDRPMETTGRVRITPAPEPAARPVARPTSEPRHAPEWPQDETARVEEAPSVDGAPIAGDTPSAADVPSADEQPSPWAAAPTETVSPSPVPPSPAEPDREPVVPEPREPAVPGWGRPSAEPRGHAPDAAPEQRGHAPDAAPEQRVDDGDLDAELDDDRLFDR